MLKLLLKGVFFFIVYASLTIHLSAQVEQAELDSILLEIESLDADTAKLAKRIEAIEYALDYNAGWAAEQVDLAINEAEKLQRKQDEIWLLSLAAEAQLYLGEYARADSLVSHAIEMCPDSSEVCPADVIARLYNLKGSTNYRRNDFVTAGKAFQLCGEWYERSETPERALAAKFNAGSIYSQLGASGKAIKVLSELINEIQDSSQLALIYNNLGICYTSRGDLDRSLDYFQKASNISQASPAIKEQATYNMALNYEDQGQYEKAVTLYEELLPQFEQEQKSRLIARTYLGLGKSYSYLNNPELGRSYIEKAEEMITPEAQPMEYRDLLTVKHEVNSELGNYSVAYRALLDLKTLRDTLANNEQRKQFAELQEKYESEKKEAENQALKMREELHLATIENQRNGLILSVIAIIFAIGIFFVVFRQNRMQKKYNIALEEKNQSIDLLHRELKHRVSNNLSFILSMLRLQKSETPDPEIQNQLQSNVDRVQAISTLYQQLDQPDDQIQVHLQNYIPEVLAPLQHSVSGQEAQPTFNVQIDSLTLDPQSAMRIGIVVNELVTNSLKHAFDQVADPEIRLSIREADEGEVLMIYEDNGPGMPSAPSPDDQASFGLSLIESLVDTLDGEMKIHASGQMKVEIRIPHAE